MLPKRGLAKKTVFLMNLILIQILLVTTSCLFLYFKADHLIGIDEAGMARHLLLAEVVVAVTSIILLNEINRLAEKEQEANVSEVLLKQSKETIELLRGQKHEFVNHMQVIHGMLQLKKEDKAKEYIMTVSSEVQTCARIHNVQNPIVAALLEKKNMDAERKGVVLDIQIELELSLLPIPGSQFSSLLGNLLDNALRAAESCSQTPKTVTFRISEDNQKAQMIMSIHNPGEIPTEIRDRIFEQGFTTKVEEGHGYGLCIVKGIVQNFNGDVDCISSKEEGTTFVVTLPLNGAETV